MRVCSDTLNLVIGIVILKPEIINSVLFWVAMLKKSCQSGNLGKLFMIERELNKIRFQSLHCEVPPTSIRNLHHYGSESLSELL